MGALVVILAILALAALATLAIIKKLVHICQPNEVLIFSGASRTVGARKLGYRIVQGGRGVRVPLLEKVSRLDLTNMIIDIRVEGAYSRGGIPLNVEGVANVKVASEEPTLGNAIERFLGKPRHEIVKVAKETLEGNLRGVLATLTPEEVNQDRVKFQTSLLHEAGADLKRLGLVLDTLKIQSVWDDRGYLDSIGRKQSAEVQMRSRIAEAENVATAAERDAHNLEEKQLIQIDAEIALAKADAQKRIVDAQTMSAAMVAEQRSVVASQIARATAELDVERQRLEQVRLQLTADRIKPAEARRDALVDKARGDAAKIVEDGKATARALRDVGQSWARAGDDAGRIFVAQNIRTLVGRIMDTAGDLHVDKLTVIDGALGGGSDLAVQATVASEKVKHMLGVDVPGALRRLAPDAG